MTDDMIASLKAWAPLVASGYEVPAAGQVMENAARALADQAAQIERLTRELAEARSDLETAAKDAEHLLPAKAAAERELDEALAEVERKDAALSILAEPANWRMGGLCDPNSGAFVGQAIARAALTKGGENGDA